MLIGCCCSPEGPSCGAETIAIPHVIHFSLLQHNTGEEGQKGKEEPIIVSPSTQERKERKTRFRPQRLRMESEGGKKQEWFKGNREDEKGGVRRDEEGIDGEP